MQGAVDKVNEIVTERGNAILARQFANATNQSEHGLEPEQESGMAGQGKLGSDPA